MPKEIEADGFSYSIIRSQRKTMTLEVRRDGQVLVRAPQRMAEARIRRFVAQKTGWVLKNLEKIQRQDTSFTSVLTQEEREKIRLKAWEIFTERALYFAKQMGVEFQKITIREQKTRWGSCSSNRNLNFNWKLLLAPPEILDYVVVHELAHLKEMNHSPAFWSEVEKILPDYKERKKWLKEYGNMLMAEALPLPPWPERKGIEAPEKV